MEQQAFLRVIALSRRDQDRERILVPSPLAVITTVGFLDLRKVSSSSELKSFLLMCIDAPGSTTNSRSSGLFEVGASIALAAIEEQNVALSVQVPCCSAGASFLVQGFLS